MYGDCLLEQASLLKWCRMLFVRQPLTLPEAPLANGYRNQLGWVKYGVTATVRGTPTTIPNPAAPNPAPAPPAPSASTPPAAVVAPPPEQQQNPSSAPEDQQPPLESSPFISPQLEESQVEDGATSAETTVGDDSSGLLGPSSRHGVIAGFTTVNANDITTDISADFLIEKPTPPPDSLPTLSSQSSDPNTTSSMPSTPIIAGSIGGVCAILGAAALIFFMRRRKRHASVSDLKPSGPGYHSNFGPGQAGQHGNSTVGILPPSKTSPTTELRRVGNGVGDKRFGNSAYPATNVHQGNSNGMRNGYAGMNHMHAGNQRYLAGNNTGNVADNHQIARSMTSSSSSSSTHSSGARSNTYSGNNIGMASAYTHVGNNPGNTDVYTANNTYARHNGHGTNNMFANASPQSTPSYPTAVPHTATPYNEKSAMHQPNSPMWSATSSPSYVPYDSKRAMISASPVPEVMKKPEGEKAGWNGGADLINRVVNVYLR
ncbi:hypothetical protein BC829DRAFT_413792 [Chytridium lagenaria]|nr:hypothetical protein BC829DRAFT_413792 [Chytridium lagenaria]